MRLFENGIILSKIEHACILHLEADPAGWLRSTIADLVLVCRGTPTRNGGVIGDGIKLLLSDPDITALPKDLNAVAQLIMSRTDFKTRNQKAFDRNEERKRDWKVEFARRRALIPAKNLVELKDFDAMVATNFSNMDAGIAARLHVERFMARDISVNDQVALVPDGLIISDIDCDILNAFVLSIDDFVYGAILGHISRARQKLMATYYPILLADPEVMTIPGTEEELLKAIFARSDYKDRAGRDALVAELK